MRLANKYAVVTGGSEGIGLGIAQALAAEGAAVCLVGRDAKKLEAARAALGPESATAVACDLALRDGVDRVVRHVTDSGRPVDVLVNNVGTSIFTPFEKATAAQLDTSIALNIGAMFFLTQGLLGRFAPAGASVVNISSYFARKMIPGRPSTLYSLTKGAIESFTKALAYELGPRGIRVNAIAPGTVDTPLRRRTIEVLPEAAQRELGDYVRRSYPLGRIGKASDMGGIAVYLASDESAWATGGIFSIDGGLTAG